MIAGLVPGSRRPSIPGGPVSVAAVLDGPVDERPEDEALVGRYRRYTYAALQAASNAAADALRALGVGPGDRVAATLPNHPDIVVAFLGAMKCGAIWVGVHRPLAAPEKAFMLRDAGVQVYLAEPDAVEQIAGVRNELPDLAHVIRIDGGQAGEWDERLAAGDPEAARADIDPFAPAAIAYTSGTTGFPKGAVHSQHNLLVPGAMQRLQGRADPTQRQGVCLPLTVLNLMVLAPLVTAQTGACCVTMDRVDAVGMADWIESERIATFAAVPTMVHDLLRHPDVKQEQLASLVRPGVGGADLPEEFRTLYRERFGAEVTIGYGMTEAPTSVTVTDPAAPPIPNEAGVSLPHLDVHIRDETGRRLPVGEVGEICVQAREDGPWAGLYTPMLGYWNRPEATAEALRDGVLHTGDLGLMDEAGHLFVKDRRNDLILRGGANVYPAEVERVLHEEPRVAACAVLGIADERLGERVVAFVQPTATGVVSSDELRALCARGLARYKVPEEFVFVEEFPRTAMGKIRKNLLRDRLSS